MKKNIFYVISMMLLLNVSVVTPVFSDAASAAKVTDVGNKTCPLSGDEIKGKDFVEYKGKRYGLCCAMCKKDFLKNPEKFIKAMESTSAV